MIVREVREQTIPSPSKLTARQHAALLIGAGLMTGGLVSSGVMNRQPGDPAFEQGLQEFHRKVYAIVDALLDEPK
jgi:hypothetical protein